MMLGSKVHFSDRENFSKIRATRYGGDVVHRRNILWCGDSGNWPVRGIISFDLSILIGLTYTAGCVSPAQAPDKLHYYKTIPFH